MLPFFATIANKSSGVKSLSLNGCLLPPPLDRLDGARAGAGRRVLYVENGAGSL
jgi:hypothetical protein